MIVVDASAIFNLLDRAAQAHAIEARLFASVDPICAPYLIDAEISGVLRKHVLLGRIPASRARSALQDFIDLRLVRFPHTNLLARAFELRNTISAYDALYVALAETLDAPLVTCDRRLASAATSLIPVEAY